MNKYPLWDLPVRIIHWSIALLLPLSWWTAEEGYLEQHKWLGLTLLVLVLTRLVWGLVGSPQARFTDFVRGPRALMVYLRTGAAETPGHSPLGAVSAIALWSLLLLQALTGTVNTDDLLLTGPFRYVFDTEVSDKLAAVHEPAFQVMLGFVTLHIAAVVYYTRVKKQRLLVPMIKGSAEGRQGTGPAKPLFLALLIAALWALVLWGLMEVAPQPAPSYW